MSDDNVVHLEKTSDGKLCRQDELPKPGSDAWIKLVILNFLKLHSDHKLAVEHTLNSVTKSQTDAFMLALIGRLVQLLGTSQESYFQKAYDRVEASSNLPDDGEVLAQFSVSLIADLCDYLNQEEMFVKNLAISINAGQALTFLLLSSDDLGGILFPNYEPN